MDISIYEFILIWPRALRFTIDIYIKTYLDIYNSENGFTSD